MLINPISCQKIGFVKSQRNVNQNIYSYPNSIKNSLSFGSLKWDVLGKKPVLRDVIDAVCLEIKNRNLQDGMSLINLSLHCRKPKKYPLKETAVARLKNLGFIQEQNNGSIVIPEDIKTVMKYASKGEGLGFRFVHPITGEEL